MTVKMSVVIACVGLTLFCRLATSADADPLIDEIKDGGHVIMIRHALAPGTGDPDNFQIGDCATQRNLNDQGRAQARQIGRWLRNQGISAARMYSSQWCRCLETAKLIGLGPVIKLTALNSFFERPENRTAHLASLGRFLSKQDRSGELIIMVTHFVTISGLTGEGVSSGEGIVLKLTPDGGYQVRSRLDFGFKTSP